MTDRTEASLIGSLLDGKFRVLQEIGRGGMAVVYAAENIDIGKRVAVKVLAAELAHSKTVNERFMREARAAAKLSSPYICAVYDVGMFQERPFIVMELLKGESLYDKLARERVLPVAEAVVIVAQAARGLKRAHENSIVHRDLKPENIFLSTDDDGHPQVKLVDFGLAKFYEPALEASNHRLTKEGALFGTPAYMSPEQARGTGSVDWRSDLWALACIMYEMLTGRTVWNIDQGVAMILAQIASHEPPAATAYRPDLPRTFDAWLRRALSRNPAERFQTPEEFVGTLEQALGLHQSAMAARPPTPYPSISPVPDANSSNWGVPQLLSATGATQQFPGQQVPAHQVMPPQVPTHDSRSVPDASVATPESEKRLKWWGVTLIALGSLAAVTGGLFLLRPEFLPKTPWLTKAQWDLERPEASAPIETAIYAQSLARAQALLGEADKPAALAAFQAAFDAGQSKVARSLLAHVSAANDAPPGGCKLLAIGHPRPFDSSGDSSKPSALLTNEGLLTAWADQAPGEDEIHARVALLDGPLRRTRDTITVSPETRVARDPELFRTVNGLGILYTDFAGPNAGVFVRQLDGQGRIAGPPQLLSTREANHPYSPVVTKDPSGGFWVVWVEPTSPRVHDIYARKLDDSLKPTGSAVALTGYATQHGGRTQIIHPAVALFGDTLYVSYALKRGNNQHLLLLRVPAELAKRGPGVVAAVNEAAGNDEEGDRFLGSVVTLNTSGINDHPALHCGASFCYATWDENKAGAHLSQIGPDGAVVWHQKLGSEASRANTAIAENGTSVLAWFENQRLLLAPLSGAGPGTPSVIGRASAAMQQAPPVLLAGAEEAEWYVSWRGYEAAAQEPFVAKVSCQ